MQKENKMKKIYIAHPYNAEEHNKRSVEKIIKDLVAKDSSILYISPIHSTGYFYNDVSYDQGMEYCYELLRYCDELLLCKGWETSRGCKLEKKYAEDHGIPIRYHIEVSTSDEEKPEDILKVKTSFGDLLATKGDRNNSISIHLERDGDIYSILHIMETINSYGELDFRTICYTDTQEPIARMIDHDILNRINDQIIYEVYQNLLTRTNDMVISDRYSVQAINEFVEKYKLSEDQYQKFITSKNSRELASSILKKIL